MSSQCFELTARQHIKYDEWLTAYLPLLKSTAMPVIDLGCGSGNDTLFLTENGILPLPCDISEDVIANMRRNFPELPLIKQLDMSKGLPFPDSSADVIIADLSLHFFDENTTFFILGEIKRVLTPKGSLLFRLNSVKDAHHGAGSGIEISPGLFLLDSGKKKRFFDEDMIHFFFKDWALYDLTESVMNRYQKPKVLWTAKAVPHSL